MADFDFFSDPDAFGDLSRGHTSEFVTGESTEDWLSTNTFITRLARRVNRRNGEITRVSLDGTLFVGLKPSDEAKVALAKNLSELVGKDLGYEQTVNAASKLGFSIDHDDTWWSNLVFSSGGWEGESLSVALDAFGISGNVKAHNSLPNRNGVQYQSETWRTTRRGDVEIPGFSVGGERWGPLFETISSSIYLLGTYVQQNKRLANVSTHIGGYTDQKRVVDGEMVSTGELELITPVVRSLGDFEVYPSTEKESTESTDDEVADPFGD